MISLSGDPTFTVYGMCVSSGLARDRFAVQAAGILAAVTSSVLLYAGPHGDSNGDETVGTIGGILLLVVLFVFAIWTASTWWKNNRGGGQ